MRNIQLDIDTQKHDDNIVDPAYKKGLCEPTVNKFRGDIILRKTPYIKFHKCSKYTLKTLSTPFFETLKSMSEFERLLLKFRGMYMPDVLFRGPDTIQVTMRNVPDEVKRGEIYHGLNKVLSAVVEELVSELGPVGDRLERDDHGIAAYARHFGSQLRTHLAKALDVKATESKREVDRLRSVERTQGH